MANVKLSNVPQTNVNKVISKLGTAYCNVIKSGLPIKTFPSVMLWGAPGIGKSQAVRQIADYITKGTGKKTVVTDVRLLLFNPIDLRGIPTANAEKTLAIWLKPQIFNMDPSDSVVNILFLDEISAAPQSVQSAAYQITLDRVIGEHKLPENCIVIAAGNRVTDKSVAYKMPKALSNRLMHFDVSGSFTEWKKWAISKGINGKVVGFLTFKPDRLMGFDTSSDDLAYPTPRSWEMVSNVLNVVSPDVNVAYDYIAGLIGVGVAIEFKTWCEVYNELPNVEDIFNGKYAPVPKNSDALYALVSSMVEYARKYKDDKSKITNSIRYANLLPADYSAVLMRDYMYLEENYKNQELTILIENDVPEVFLR